MTHDYPICMIFCTLEYMDQKKKKCVNYIFLIYQQITLHYFGFNQSGYIHCKVQTHIHFLLIKAVV